MRTINMTKFQKIVLPLLLLFGLVLSTKLYVEKLQPPLASTLAPAFQIAGKTTGALNQALSKVIPVNELDEKEYGEAIALRYESLADSSDPDFTYANDLLKSLAIYAQKPFDYRVYVLPQSYANAYALPGGVILVTKGLLQTMQSEAELASVLAHEIGHVEREHCFSAVKYEILFEKLKSPTMGRLADFAVNLLLRHSFSKTQEADADEYAYDLILKTQYDPAGVGNAFRRLWELHNPPADSTENTAQKSRANVFRDYFITHPPLPLRIEKFDARAEQWWKDHPAEKRYLGRSNLSTRTCFCKSVDEDEWLEKIE